MARDRTSEPETMAGRERQRRSSAGWSALTSLCAATLAPSSSTASGSFWDRPLTCDLTRSHRWARPRPRKLALGAYCRSGAAATDHLRPPAAGFGRRVGPHRAGGDADAASGRPCYRRYTALGVRVSPLTPRGRRVLARLRTAWLRPSLPKPPAGEKRRPSGHASMRRASRVPPSV